MASQVIDTLWLFIQANKKQASQLRITITLRGETTITSGFPWQKDNIKREACQCYDVIMPFSTLFTW